MYKNLVLCFTFFIRHFIKNFLVHKIKSDLITTKIYYNFKLQNVLKTYKM